MSVQVACEDWHEVVLKTSPNLTMRAFRPVNRSRRRSRRRQLALACAMLSYLAAFAAGVLALLSFVAPTGHLAVVLGVAAGVGPVLGIVIGVVAIVFNVMSMRRFWRADHRWRWAYTFISAAIICLLVVLLVRDVTELVT